MNIHQLELLVAVVEEGSFSRGAEAANITQSTVSQHIAALESEFELRLLDRTGQGVLLTRAGELFLQQARQVLAKCTELRQAMDGFRGLQETTLTVGASNIPANYLIPGILARLASEHPGIALTMHTGDSQSILELLMNDEVELALVGNHGKQRGVEYLPLANDLLILAVSSQHPWSKCREITLSDLEKEPIVVRESGSGSDLALRQALKQAGFEPERLQIAAQLGSNEAVRQAVLNGFGAAFLSEISIRDELKQGKLCKVPVVGFTVERQFWVVAKSQRTASPATQAFVKLLQKSFAV